MLYDVHGQITGKNKMMHQLTVNTIAFLYHLQHTGPQHFLHLSSNGEELQVKRKWNNVHLINTFILN